MLEFRAVSTITGETLDTGSGDRQEFEKFLQYWDEDANMVVESREVLD